MALGGGGVQGGRVVGKTDARAEKPADDPYGPEDLAATLYHLLGVDPEEEFYTPEGRPVKIVNNGRITSGDRCKQARTRGNRYCCLRRVRFAAMSSLLCFASLCTLCLCGESLWAEPPVASYLFPAGGRRGTTVNVHVGGLYLHKDASWELLGPGVKVPSPRLAPAPTRWFEGAVAAAAGIAAGGRLS